MKKIKNCGEKIKKKVIFAKSFAKNVTLLGSCMVSELTKTKRLKKIQKILFKLMYHKPFHFSNLSPHHLYTHSDSLTPVSKQPPSLATSEGIRFIISDCTTQMCMQTSTHTERQTSGLVSQNIEYIVTPIRQTLRQGTQFD